MGDLLSGIYVERCLRRGGFTDKKQRRKRPGIQNGEELK